MPAHSQSPGARANKSGNKLEQAIRSVLDTEGIVYKYQCQLDKPSIYNSPIKVDFLIEPSPRIPFGLIIEAKWQDASGSVDEKFPYLWLNIIEVYPYPTIVVIDGSGARPGAVAWFKEAVDGIILRNVFSLEEFIRWSNRKL